MFPSAGITDQSFQVRVENLLTQPHLWGPWESGVGVLTDLPMICWGPQKLLSVSFRLHHPSWPLVIAPEFVKVVLDKRRQLGDLLSLSVIMAWLDHTYFIQDVCHPVNGSTTFFQMMRVAPSWKTFRRESSRHLKMHLLVNGNIFMWTTNWYLVFAKTTPRPGKMDTVTLIVSSQIQRKGYFWCRS